MWTEAQAKQRDRNAFEIVTRLTELYTLRYVEEDIAILYEVLRGVGDCVWGGGVFLAGAVPWLSLSMGTIPLES